ncbi:MAG: transcriptional regulator GcvA [Rhodospirillaceae bacterium]|nr:transcriptional regulator GcvA [Rhodospirillaceae bacterium]
MRLPPLKAVRYFECAARHLSFTKAADELAVTHSAISHQIKALEEWLGVLLFERGARALSLTEAGRRYLPPVRSAFQLLAESAAELRAFPGAGPLTVSALPSLTSKWLVPRLHDFQMRHPEIEVRISATDRLDPVGEGDVDIGIRYGRGLWPGVEAELLLQDEVFPICSPNLLTGSAPLREPKDLVGFKLISDMDWRRAHFDFWPRWLSEAGVPGLELKTNLTFNYSNLMIQAAIDGLGVALGNTMLAGDDIKSGRLVQPFQQTVKLDTGYYLIYGKGALRQTKVKAFRDWIVAQIEEFQRKEAAGA